jgi:hypothetical protein
MATQANTCLTPIPPAPSSGTDCLPQVSPRDLCTAYPYGAINLALIDLEYGHVGDVVSTLRNVLTELRMRDERAGRVSC